MYGFGTALVRAVTAVPGHACFGVFMGAWYGMAKRWEGAGFESRSKTCRTMALLLPALSELFDFCERALSLTDLPLTLFVPVVKVTAIALVARFSCALCADAGQSALSSLLAAAGTLCALVCALPLMEALLEMVEGFL